MIFKMKQIKTFEDACKIKGYEPEKILPDVTAFPVQHQKALISTAKLIIINEALNFVDNNNQEWKPDWNDYDQDKHYPWFDMEVDSSNPSGFRWGAVYFACSNSSVGSRLVYRTRRLAEYAGKQFIDLYRDLMVL